ncbi:hypothetical protein HQ305_14695, partial [Rhodococcus sp. BP-149]|nr:hypothetical protein [Rhodococcus sp. BP-149]
MTTHDGKAGGRPPTDGKAGGLAIEAVGLMKRFGDTVAVDGVDLAVHRHGVPEPLH